MDKTAIYADLLVVDRGIVVIVTHDKRAVSISMSLSHRTASDHDASILILTRKLLSFKALLHASA